VGVDERGELPDVAVDAAVGTDAALEFLVLWVGAEPAEEGSLVFAPGGRGRAARWGAA